MNYKYEHFHCDIEQHYFYATAELRVSLVMTRTLDTVILKPSFILLRPCTHTVRGVCRDVIGWFRVGRGSNFMTRPNPTHK